MIGMLKAFLKLVLIKKDGTEETIYDGESHSWVKNYYQFILAQSSGIPTTATLYGTNAVNIDGNTSSTSITLHEGFYAPKGSWFATNNTSTGCEVGTGSGIESFTDYALGGICTNGTGAGQFQFSNGSQTFSTATNGSVLRCKIDRTFTNNSGSTINVAESGIYGNLTWDTLNKGSYFMLNRDTFGTIGVANGDALYVAYTIQQTMPGTLV